MHWNIGVFSGRFVRTFNVGRSKRPNPKNSLINKIMAILGRVGSHLNAITSWENVLFKPIKAKTIETN